MNIPEHPFYDYSNFEWVKNLEDNYLVIKKELSNIINNNASDGTGENWTITHPDYISKKDNNSVPWRTYEFLFFGIKQLIHCGNCPNTFDLLESIPELITAQFSLLEPNTRVKPHKGYSRMILRNHLPLIVPKEGDMGIRVKDEVKIWEEGKLLSFYDAFDHEAWNLSNETRVVLMFDIAHPNCGYNAKQICDYKIENVDDPFLLKIADKQKWKEWLKQGYFS